MDIVGLLDHLRREFDRVDATILTLEKTRAADVLRRTGKRGRKSMGQAERIVVSERMKRYWSTRRSVAGEATLNARP